MHKDNIFDFISCKDSISGIGVKSAEFIISEDGKDMSCFPTADHLTA